jgi:phosphopantothenoylcysteine decarboxylase/phosphopantothenate--cysteine ligase
MIDPAGVNVVRIGSAAQLSDAVSKLAPAAHVLVMAAAVADFPAGPGRHRQDQEERR